MSLRRKRKNNYTLFYVSLGLIIGYLLAGPLTYNRIIEDLESQLTAPDQPTYLSGDLTIAGSSTVLPITQEVANMFMEKHRSVTISVGGGGSGHGIKAAGSGEIDIGEASRNIKESELLKYPDLVAFSVGKDSVAIIINPDNPVAANFDITMEEIGAIFSGEISNWSELGGENHEIEVYTREEGSGTREVFTSYVLGEKTMVATASVKPSNGEMRASVVNNRYAVAYVSFGYIDASVTAAKIDGVEATVEDVNSGNYPITRILWIFTKGMPSTLESAFITYIQSPEGQNVVEELGYIPIYDKEE
jgi:phosphate transport system substrate-binding protein